MLFLKNPIDYMQVPREEGKRGTGGVFVTPAQVELPKTV